MNIDKDKFFLGSSPEKNNSDLWESKIKLIEPVKINTEEISEGGFGRIYENLYKAVSHGKEIKLVRKEYFDGLSDDEIMDILKKSSHFDDSGMKSLKMYTDGESLYSKNLNEDGKIALSWNNDVNNEEYENLKNSIEIDNVENVVDNLVNESIKALKYGMCLNQDVLMFVVDSKKENQNIDFLAGDYDMINETKSGDYGASLITLTNNLIAFKKFIDKFVKKDKIQEYYEIIDKKMGFDFTSDFDDSFGDDDEVLNEWIFAQEENKILTQDGLKDISEYDHDNDFVFKEWIDGESDKGKVLEIINDKYHKNFSIEQIESDKEKITEKTRLFIGDLGRGDEELLNNRENELMITGQMYFIGSKNIKKIPNGMEVVGRALFDKSSLSEISDGVKFYGESSFNNIPKLKISGNVEAINLKLINTMIEKEDLERLKELKKSGKVGDYMLYDEYEDWDDE